MAFSSQKIIATAKGSNYIEALGPDGAEGVISGDFKVHTFTATKTGANGFQVTNAGSESV
jgi:hypothetical protein